MFTTTWTLCKCGKREKQYRIGCAPHIEPELDGQWPLFLHIQAAADIARKGHRTGKRVRGTSIRLETNKYAKNFILGVSMTTLTQSYRQTSHNLSFREISLHSRSQTSIPHNINRTDSHSLKTSLQRQIGASHQAPTAPYQANRSHPQISTLHTFRPTSKAHD